MMATSVGLLKWVSSTKYQIFSFLLFSTERAYPGYMNVNNIVDDNDLIVCIEEFGCSGDCLADANDNFVVNVHDLLVIIGAWGNCE